MKEKSKKQTGYLLRSYNTPVKSSKTSTSPIQQNLDLLAHSNHRIASLHLYIIIYINTGRKLNPARFHPLRPPPSCFPPTPVPPLHGSTPPLSYLEIVFSVWTGFFILFI